MDVPPVYGISNENQLLIAQQNQEGDTDVCRLLSRYTSFWQETMSQFKTAKQRYTVDFSPVYGTLNENRLLRSQQNQEDTDIPGNVYCQDIPFVGQKSEVAVVFYLAFHDVRVF